MNDKRRTITMRVDTSELREAFKRAADSLRAFGKAAHDAWQTAHGRPAAGERIATGDVGGEDGTGNGG